MPEGEDRLHAINAGGGEERALLPARDHCGSCGFVSPDGKHVITLAGATDDRLTALLVRTDGTGEPVTPTGFEGLSTGPGPWTPGGDVAVSAFDGVAHREGIYLASANLAVGTRLTTAGAGVVHIPLAFSRDASQLLFLHQTQDHAGHLYVVGTDGVSEPARLNPDGTQVPFFEVPGAPASFSPDGRRVAFAAFDGDNPTGRSALFVADATSPGTPTRIAGWANGIQSAHWSPTGEWISFERELDGSWAVHLIRPDGSGEHALVSANDRAMSWGAAWAPDGRWVAIQRGTSATTCDATCSLWLVRADGTGAEQLTSLPGRFAGLTWVD